MYTFFITVFVFTQKETLLGWLNKTILLNLPILHEPAAIQDFLRFLIKN